MNGNGHVVKIVKTKPRRTWQQENERAKKELRAILDRRREKEGKRESIEVGVGHRDYEGS